MLFQRKEVIIMNNVSVIIKNMAFKQRSDKRYEGRITVNGKRKSFYGTTKVEVKNKAKEYLAKVENGYKEPEKIVFNEYIEYWLKNYKLSKVEPTSYSRLYSVYIHQIHDTIGQKKIGQITTKDIQTLIDEHANPSDSSVRPLALSGLKRIVHLLNPCLNKAVEEGIISKNPCDYVILPKESCIQTRTKEQFSLSDRELEEFRKAALSTYKSTKEYRSRDAFILLLILNLGLRVGEALALEWTDIDLTNGIVFVRKTIQDNITDFESRDEEHKTYKKTKHSTKTPKGVRILHMNETVIHYINELKLYDQRHNIKSKYVSCTSVGTLNCSRNLQRSLDRLVTRTNIDKHVSLHTLRHTFGSALLRNGVNVEVVSKLMGHSNITITYNKYIHVIQEEEAKAMDAVSVC